MQQARKIDALALFIGQTDLLGQGAGKFRHALRVAARVGVLGVDGPRQGVQYAHEKVLHIVIEGGIFQKDRTLIADVIQEFQVNRIELRRIALIDGHQNSQRPVVAVRAAHADKDRLTCGPQAGPVAIGG